MKQKNTKKGLNQDLNSPVWGSDAKKNNNLFLNFFLEAWNTKKLRIITKTIRTELAKE